MRKKFILMLAVACTLQMKASVLSTCMDSTKIETKYCTKSLPFGSPSNEDAVAIGSLWSDNWFVGVSGGTTCKTPKCFIIKHFGVFRFSR